MERRGTSNPRNRFARLEIAYEPGEGPPASSVTLLEDASRSILSENDSPDVGFRWSVNPYRGCVHACAYCYARPSHEYLDLGAGTDFDTQIVVKRRAPELLRAAFDAPSWKGELVMFSGVTDCYQPVESKLELTRGCLEVCLAYKNPVGVVTKSALVQRDADLLAALAREASASVSVSLPFADAGLARAIEPWAPAPETRLRVVETLARAGVPVGVLLAPIIPGLNDGQIPEILARARTAGARFAGWVLLRLPGAVAAVFEERVRAALPLRAERILSRVRETRGGGRLYDPRFHARQRGQGPYADAIEALFESTCRRLGFADREREAERPSTFRRPTGQGDLFG